MARSTDPKKAALWEGRFRRFAESGLPVTRFCASEGVSESSFYYWEAKLAPSGRHRPTRVPVPPLAQALPRAAASDLFKPVAVVPARCGVVVRLPGGTQIEVDASQLDAIQAIVAAVQGDHDRAAKRDASSDTPLCGKRSGVMSC